MAIVRHGGLEFEWNDDKAQSNAHKHGITFMEAATVFGDLNGVLKYDRLNSEEEQRFLLIGRSFERKILTVVHVVRRERLRIVSARQATAWERREYERTGVGERL